MATHLQRIVTSTGNGPDAAFPAVSVSGLTRAFDGREVLRGLDLDIEAGEFVALLGRSGSGKTTLLRALGGLDPVTHGRVDVPERIAVVFQEPRLLPWKRVAANVALGLARGGATDRRAGDALAEVGLADHADAWPVTLSGGEAQRVALARALVREPDLLLLDEPFGALDALTRIKVHSLVQRLIARHRPATLLVTHDVDEAVLLADRAVVLTEGRISLDLPLGPSGTRSPGGSRFAELRTRLLAELGVNPTEPLPTHSSF